MRLPLLFDFNFESKKVLVRCDFDGGRLEENLPTVKYLLDNGAREVILMGHLGRPEGKVVENLRMASIEEKFCHLVPSEKIVFLENLRFDKREEENDEEFAKELASRGDFYVNEAFAVSHRQHASIVGVPKLLPHCAGLHFASEVENLSKVLENPERPLVFVIGGAKPETKMAYVESFASKADAVLIGGTLVKEKDKIKNRPTMDFADLNDNGLDINKDSIERFCDLIMGAGTVVWNGPMGKYEVPQGAEGTKRIAEQITKIRGLKIVGGGDTISALKKFGLLDNMDYVSTGGGAMLEFLAKGTLPGIKALTD
jgi:phosphoglycerate kinase